MAKHTEHSILGVIENMSYFVMPDGSHNEIFGEGGGEIVADRLSRITGSKVPLMGQVPLDPALREGGDGGEPIAISSPESETGAALNAIADQLTHRRTSLAGKSLGLGVTP